MTNFLIRVFMMILAVILLLILASVLFVTKFRKNKELPAADGGAQPGRGKEQPCGNEIPVCGGQRTECGNPDGAAFNVGMNAHIVKPVDMKVLIKTVRNLQTGAGAAGTLN